MSPYDTGYEDGKMLLTLGHAYIGPLSTDCLQRLGPSNLLADAYRRVQKAPAAHGYIGETFPSVSEEDIGH